MTTATKNRVRYQVRGYQGNNLQASFVTWTNTERDARKVARELATYKSCDVGPNCYCACDVCLKMRNTQHVEISRYKRSHNELIAPDHEDIAYYSKESTGWTWTEWE